MSDPLGSPSSRIDFGCIAEDYEQTRGIPDAFMKEVIESILQVCSLSSTDLVLELGCGAGRFLRELAKRKIPVIGMDISKEMLQKACSNQRSFKFLRSNLVSGDAVAIPLNRGLFQTILVIHLFHLMTDWQDALAETIQVLSPGGTIITGYVGGLTHQSFLSQLYQQRRRELGYTAAIPGAYPAEVIARLRELGGRVETNEFSTRGEVPLRVTYSYLERRVFSSMWRNLPDVIHRQIMQDVHNAATTRFKDLDDIEQIEIEAQLHFVTFE
jgi:ubiquinone/menaquinone biosynthesis C-methylase UbiE